MRHLKQKLISLLLAGIMVLSMLPVSWAAEASGPSPQEMIAGIEGYLQSFSPDPASGKPGLDMSLYPFALEAAGLDESQFELSTGGAIYIYSGRFKSATDEKNNPWSVVLARTDKIFDMIARGEDPGEEVQALLAQQGADGWFGGLWLSSLNKHNASTQARAILAIDAYYGVDPDAEWPNAEEGTRKGRVGAVLALIGEQYPAGSSTNTGGFAEGSFHSSVLAAMGKFQYSSNTLYGACNAIIALSNYKDYPTVDPQTKKTLGEAVSVSIDAALGRIAPSASTPFIDSYYIIPALVAANRENLLSGTDGNNKPYNLLETIAAKRQADGSYKNISSQNNNTTAAGIEFDTQQVLIALSDMVAGESAWKRIITPAAQNIKDVLADRKSLAPPGTVEDTARLELPVTGPNGSVISWSSDKPELITNDGYVTLPEEGKRTVTLTATVSKGAASKTKDFKISVKSQIKSQAELLLDKALTAVDATYGKDLSSAGFWGAFALAGTGMDLSGYNFYDVAAYKNGDRSAFSAKDYALVILQLALTGQNPYHYKDINYVEELERLDKEGNGDFGGAEDNIWTLLALDAAGGSYNEGLIANVSALPGDDEGTSLDTLGRVLCALAAHRSVSQVDAAIEQAVEKIHGCQAEAGEYAGIFSDGTLPEASRNNITTHSVVASGLTAIGEILDKEAEGSVQDGWLQSGQTPLDILQKYQLEDGTFKELPDSAGGIANFDAVIALGDIVAEADVWSEACLTRGDLVEAVEKARILIGQGLELYSPLSAQTLEIAKKDAEDFIASGETKGFGEKYFNLVLAIRGLTADFLPVFTDEASYTAGSFADFKTKLTELGVELARKQSTVETVFNACDAVIKAYEKLEKVNTAAAFAALPDNAPKSLSAFSVSAQSPAPASVIESTRARAQALLDKTMEGFDKKYGSDVSGLGYWGVFELAAAGRDPSQYKVYDVTTHKRGIFSTYQATDYAAIVMQLILTGDNPYNYKGINYVEKLKSCEVDHTGAFGPYANSIWALLALDAAGADYNPALVTIVKNQAASAGFNLDMRGWALCAVQNHRDVIGETEMRSIAESFRDRQVAAGEFASMFDCLDYGLNINTHGCSVSGLAAAGADLASDEWTRDGRNPIDIFEKYQRPDGQFYYSISKYESKFPDYNKDAIIGLGDIVRGSNVWQRLCLERSALDATLQDAGTILGGDMSVYTAASAALLRNAYDNAEKIPEGEIKGHGEKYFRLLDAIKGLDSDLIPEFTDEREYTQASFAGYKSGVLNVRKLLEKRETSSQEVSEICVKAAAAYGSLTKNSSTGPDTPSDPPKATITVTFELIGDSIHRTPDKHTAFQTWIPAVSATVPQGSSVFDVFDKVLSEQGLSYEETAHNYIGGIRAPPSFGSFWLFDFNNGPDSGWMYTVNGHHPDVGLRTYILEDGDAVVWHYTDNYRREEGSDHWGDSNAPSVPGAGATKEVASVLDAKGRATSTIKGDTLSDLLKKAQDAADGGTAIAALTVGVPGGAMALDVALTREAVGALTGAKNTALKISSAFSELTFDPTAAAAIARAADSAGAGLTITVASVPFDDLSSEAKAAAGNRPVYDFSVTAGGADISTFGGGSVRVGIPYKPTAEENLNAIVIYYINETGGLEVVKNCRYDEKTGLVYFTAAHFSRYAVGYNKKSFADVTEKWMQEAVEYMAARDIIAGVGGNQFAPDNKTTRAQLVSMLIHALEPIVDASGTEQFTDVPSGSYYYDAALAAKALGISEGVGGNRFDPDAEISREQMLAIAYRSLVKLGLLNRYDWTDIETGFSDRADLSGYAKEAVEALAGYGLIDAAGGKLNPKSAASRAECVWFLYTVLTEMK